MKLVWKILIGVALGILLGVLLNAFAPDGLLQVLVRTVNTFTGVFSQYISFMVPLIIVGLVTPAIAETGRNAGRLLLLTVGIAYASTVLSGLLSYGVSVAAFPSLVDKEAVKRIAEAKTFAPYVTVAIPPLLDVMSALVLAFLAGLGISASKGETLGRVVGEFRSVVTLAIEKSLVPLLPFYIFGIFLDMTAAGKAGTVLKAFAAVIAVFTALSFVVILLQFLVAGAVARKNPFKAIGTMLPAYVTALGTSSSAATIPVTRAQTIANGVRKETADFVIPLCATVHLAGSTLKIVACAVALVLMAGGDVSFGKFLYFILMTGVMMVAAPGVPGGAVMAALGILESILGFDQSQLALMITLYVATDSIGTACNITGDGAIALLIDRFSGKGASPEAGKERG